MLRRVSEIRMEGCRGRTRYRVLRQARYQRGGEVILKYKKAGERMTLVHLLREMNDMLTHCMEGEEVVNCYNDIMMDQIEYVGDDMFRKVTDEHGGEVD